MMSNAMDSNSEVHFKEKLEEEGVKAETASENATIRFDFQASTPATSPPGRGPEARTGDREDQGVELKKFSCRTLVHPHDRSITHQ